MKSKIYGYILLVFLVLSCACLSRKTIPVELKRETQRLNNLQEIQRSVLKLTCSAYYQNYFYAQPKAYDDTVSQQTLFLEKRLTTNSVSGTSLILLENSRKMLLLTCYHLFDFPDTVRTYYRLKDGRVTKYLQSLSVKNGQNIYVTHRDGSRSIGRLIAKDYKNDIALVETDPIDNTLLEQPFKGSFYKENKATFGKEVYLVGFPKGFLYVTKGLISPSPYKNKYMVSAPFNRGFSGGIMIAFDLYGTSYQYYGMANSMAYTSEYVLRPREDNQIAEIYKNIPYEDDIYIKELKLVNYGLTFAIKSNIIYNFLNEQREFLRMQGHYFKDELK